MINVEATICPDIGMVDGWYTYQINIFGTRYEDRDVYNKAKLLWISELKCWQLSGSMICPTHELAHIIKVKVSKIAKEFAISIKIEEEVK
jgi:hypothetical protein